MEEQYIRTAYLLGQEALDRLRRARVAVFGIGGVGGHAVEALARSGVGTLDLFDNDTVSLSNLNRQLIATRSALGQYKVDAAAARIRDIDPEIVVNTHRVFFMPDTSAAYDFSVYDYVIDAIDTVTGKLEIITKARQAGVPVISCMGTGNKLDPTRFQVADLSKTSMCPLARIMRKECAKRGLTHVKAVYSQEEARPSLDADGNPVFNPESGKSVPGSCAFVPSVAGLILAGEVIRDLAGSGL